MKIDTVKREVIGQAQPGGYLVGKGKWTQLPAGPGYRRTLRPYGNIVAAKSAPPPSYKETVPLDGSINTFEAIEWWDYVTATWFPMPAEPYFNNGSGMTSALIRFSPNICHPEYTGGWVDVAIRKGNAFYDDWAFSIYAANSGTTFINPNFHPHLRAVVNPQEVANMNQFYNTIPLYGAISISLADFCRVNSIIYTFQHGP